MTEIERENEALRDEVARLRECGNALVRKLDLTHDDPEYYAVWACSQVHRGPYRGTQYTDEMEALRAALAAAPGPQCDVTLTHEPTGVRITLTQQEYEAWLAFSNSNAAAPGPQEPPLDDTAVLNYLDGKDEGWFLAHAWALSAHSIRDFVAKRIEVTRAADQPEAAHA